MSCKNERCRWFMVLNWELRKTSFSSQCGLWTGMFWLSCGEQLKNVSGIGRADISSLGLFIQCCQESFDFSVTFLSKRSYLLVMKPSLCWQLGTDFHWREDCFHIMGNNMVRKDTSKCRMTVLAEVDKMMSTSGVCCICQWQLEDSQWKERYLRSLLQFPWTRWLNCHG